MPELPSSVSCNHSVRLSLRPTIFEKALCLPATAHQSINALHVSSIVPLVVLIVVGLF